MTTNLWNTETQLSGPEFHLARYPSNVGFKESRKAPMTGILNLGPAIPFLFNWYLTGLLDHRREDEDTLVVDDDCEEGSDDNCPGGDIAEIRRNEREY